MSLLDFTQKLKKKRRFNKTHLISIFLALTTLTFIGTSLASNINLNNGAAVEFGQGVTATTACDSDVTITPYSNFVNSEHGGSFKFSRIKISGISNDCNQKEFTIKAYKIGVNDPLNLYELPGQSLYLDQVIVFDDNGNFSLINSSLPDENIESGGSDNNYEFVINFSSNGVNESIPSSDAANVDRITIESRDGTAPATYSFKTVENGVAQHSVWEFWGQTFTIPDNKNGKINSISDLTIQRECYGDSTDLNAIVRIWDSPEKNTLLATSNTLTIPTDCPTGGGFSSAINYVATFRPFTVSSGSTYYFEMQIIRNDWIGNVFLYEAYSMPGGESPYLGGLEYRDGIPDSPGVNGTSFDIKFTVNMKLS